MALRTVAALLLLATLCPAQRPAPSPEILGFETSAPDTTCPTGWACSPSDTVSLDTATVHSGKAALHITRTPGRPDPASAVTLRLPIDFAGARMTVSGYIKTANMSGFAGITLAILSDSGPLAMLRPQCELQPTTDWKRCESTLGFPPGANAFELGVLFAGTGEIWADDLEITVDGKPLSAAPPLAPSILTTDHEFDRGTGIHLTELTPLQTDNLVTLGKVWGFLKYHHPRVIAGAFHFDYELFRVLPAVLAAEDRTQSNAAIVAWIERLGSGTGPIPACNACGYRFRDNAALKPDTDWIADQQSLGPQLSNLLERILYQRPPHPGQFYRASAPGVGNPVFVNELPYGNLQFPDTGYQLLGLFRYWNMVDYWFPYRDVMGEDWPAVLREFIPQFATAATRAEYLHALQLLTTRIHDTHRTFSAPQPLTANQPFISCRVAARIRYLDHSFVFSGPLDSAPGGPEPGDIIEAVDGKPVRTIVDEATPTQGTSNQAALNRNLADLLTNGDCSKPAALQLRRGDKTLNLEAPRSPYSDPLMEQTRTHDLPGPTFQLLSPEVAYLKLSSVKIADVPGYITSAAHTKGLIVDIRNYPSEFVPFVLGGRLIDKPTPFVRMSVADPDGPGTFYLEPPIVIQPLQPRYTGKIVILVDETTQSQAEYTAMALQASGHATVIGSQTAGADGNVSFLTLPGGVRSSFSGIGVFYPDGRPTQRIGIVPDITITPTIDGLRNNRDELLDAATALLAPPSSPTTPHSGESPKSKPQSSPTSGNPG